MEKKYAKNNKFVAFMKRNMYYIIMGVCVTAIGAMISVAIIASNSTGEEQQFAVEVPDVTDESTLDTDLGDSTVTDTEADTDIDVDVDAETEVIVFITPVEDGVISVDYSSDTLVYCSTLNQYSVHLAIDYVAAEGAMARAVYDGTVTSVTYDALNGNSVTIDHGNGLETIYQSLGDPLVEEGQVVTQGTLLGELSTSATKEMDDGAHLHFIVKKDGEIVNPHDYLPSGDK